MLRVLFFGTPDFAAPSLEALIASPHEVVGAICQPDRPSGRGQRLAEPPVKQLARAHGIPVWQPETLKAPAFLDLVRGLSVDLGVVAAYGRLLPADLLAIPRLGLINVHASLLPRWRGASPVHHAVMAGDTETGVTIMRVVLALDAGPILARAVRAIGPDETSTEVERDLAQIGAPLLVETVDGLERGTVAEHLQDDTRVTLAPRLTKEDGRLDWSLPAAVLHNRVRGLQPWPLAYTWLRDLRLAVLRTKIASAGDGRVHPTPGSVFGVATDRLVVAAGGGTALEVLALQPEGRRAMTAREFLAGHPVMAGAAFQSSPRA